METPSLKDTIVSRFSDAPWANIEQPVLIAGLGGIGSNLAYILSKMYKGEIKIVDFDSVDLPNIGAQFYKTADVGEYKTVALYRSLKLFNPTVNIIPINRKIEIGFNTEAITFSCFDNMKARKILYDSWKNDIPYPYKRFKIFIDARMEAESFQIYAVTQDRLSLYEETLFSDNELEDLPCSFKSTTHNAFITSGVMVALLTNYITNIVLEENIREVPFRTEFNVPLLTFI